MKLTRIYFASIMLLLLGAVGAAAAPVSSKSATFDFGAFADGSTIGGITGFEENWTTVVTGGWLTQNGIRVTAFGEYKGREANAFLDSTSGGLPAGAGVCHKASCTTDVKGADTADDNITKDEKLSIVAEAGGAEIVFSDLLLRDAKHKLVDGAAIINGGMHMFLAGRIVDDVDFLGNTLTIEMAKDGSELYLGEVTASTVAPVPLPAPALLLMGGMMALGGLKARRRVPAA